MPFTKKRNIARERYKRLLKSSSVIPVCAFKNEMINVYQTKNPRIILFSGDMVVVKIVRGEKFDIIYGSFNIFPSKIREIIFADSFARRQLITVKRGQFVHIVGEGRLYTKEVEYKDKDGNLAKRKIPYWQLFSYCNSGYYVPKAYDIKKFNKEVDDGEEINYIDNMQEEEQKKFESAIDEILNKNFNEIYDDGEVK